MDIKNQDIPRAAAHEYVSMAQSYMEQALGRECELKELAEFSETAGASFLGSMYALLREKEGKETSEAWLKKALTSMASTVRLSGADALVKTELTIKDMPNRLAKREDVAQAGPKEAPQAAPSPAAPPAPQEAPVCKCKVEAGGTCTTCLRAISGTMGSAFKSTSDMLVIALKIAEICDACKLKHGDEALARIVPEMMRIGLEKKATIEQIATIMLQFGMSLGVQQMPLTQEALKESVPEEG
jgi:hypothetical protein